MALTNFIDDSVTRTAWRSDNGSVMVAVTGILEPGEYDISKTTDKDGNIMLKCKKKDSQ